MPVYQHGFHPKCCLRGHRADTQLLPIAAALACVLSVTPGIVAATEPTIQCRDVREIKFQIERAASGSSFALSADAQRFIEHTFGADARAVLVNIDGVAAYLNSHPVAFQGLNRFSIIGDVSGTTGPIFLISPICTPLCRSFEVHRSSDAFSATQIDIGQRYLSIGYPTEDVWQERYRWRALSAV